VATAAGAAKLAPAAGSCPLSWWPAPRARRLATVTLIALVAALVAGRAPLLLLAAPSLAALAAASRGSRPGEVEVGAYL
jgi:hypothetical protein